MVDVSFFATPLRSGLPAMTPPEFDLLVKRLIALRTPKES